LPFNDSEVPFRVFSLWIFKMMPVADPGRPGGRCLFSDGNAKSFGGNLNANLTHLTAAECQFDDDNGW
jgi:hypothetical protein